MIYASLLNATMHQEFRIIIGTLIISIGLAIAICRAAWLEHQKQAKL